MLILIAEDNPTSRNILVTLLQKYGHMVVETANGEEAWEVLKKPDAPRFAILDWMMPVMDGLEVVRRVRALETEQPPYIIMLTGRSEKADIIAGLDAGADDYLAKPIHPGELKARIEVGRRMIEMRLDLLNTRNALAHEATHDHLTGILNRKGIETALSRELSRNSRRYQGLAVGICDIDNFKMINDTHGHKVGNEVLCGFVSLLENRLRKYDQIGRFDGEEFLVIAPAVKKDAAKILFESLRVTVEKNHLITRAGNVSINISIGVKCAQENETLDTLFTAANSALDQAKKEGGNRVCLNAEGTVKSSECL